MESEKLISWLASVSNDPYAFVMGAFPWGEPNTTLEKERGPEDWQKEVLCLIRDKIINLNEALQIARASGHGIGKSALVAWIILWGHTTLVDTKGVVTANTENQLKTKTWAELGKWFHLFIGKEYFRLTATCLYQPDRERTWRIDMVPWSERNTEAFAGLHNKGKRIILIFDEGSAIPDVIYEVAEGALTDDNTQILWAVFGNPTRNIGRFKECFAGGKFSDQWFSRQIDSRSVSFTNKARFQKWIDVYGEDSDFVRIRVKGMFPRHGEMEFFSAHEIEEAMAREVTTSLTDPLALGVDVARYGSNNSVIFPRKGRDARSIPRQVYQGLSTVQLANKVLEAQQQYHADGLFIDGGGVGGGVVDNVRHMQLFCFDVQFGGKADVGGSDTGNPGEKYANKRAEMYGRLRNWIKTGALPADVDLKHQMLSVTYSFNNRDEILLCPKDEMMEDGVSPDDLDALALTFAYPLAAHAEAGGEHLRKPQIETDYNPFDAKHMAA